MIILNTKVLIVMSAILLCKIGLVEARCYSPNQMEVCNDSGKCTCEECPVCGPGFGLNYECGGRISTKQSLKCIQCDLGATYSSTNDSAICQPCPSCYGHKMLHPCRTTRETKCSPDECEAGFEWNFVVEACEFSQKATTHPPPPKHTTPYEIMISSSSTLPASSTQSKKRQSLETTTKSQMRSHNDSPSKDHHGTTLTVGIITLVVVVVVVVALVLTALFVKRKKIHQCCKEKVCSKEHGTADEEYPLNSIEIKIETASAPEEHREYPWSHNLLLRDIDHNLYLSFTMKLSCSDELHKMGWRALGNELKLDASDLESIGIASKEKWGIRLFDALHAHRPGTTLNEFVDALYEIKRNDIVNFVMEHYNNLKSPKGVEYSDTNS